MSRSAQPDRSDSADRRGGGEIPHDRPRGHRALEHTADVLLEAWGPTGSACLEEAGAALIEICVDATRAVHVDDHTPAVGSGSFESLLLETLEEIIFLLDTGPDVPILVTSHERHDGSVEVTIGLARRDSVELTGSAPKGISRSEWRVEVTPERTACSFLVDV